MDGDIPHVDGINEIFMETLTLLSRNVVGSNESKSSEDEAPDAFHTHNHRRRSFHTLEEVLFVDSLESLNGLSEKDKNEAEDLEVEGSRVLAFITKDVARRLRGRGREIRIADDKNGKENDAQTGPLTLLQNERGEERAYGKRLLEPANTEDTTEDEDGATDHLPDRDREPEETNEPSHELGMGQCT